MRAVLTSRDHALRLTIGAVIAGEALLFLILFIARCGLGSVAMPSPVAIVITVGLVAACIALACGRFAVALGAGTIALASELLARPHGSKLAVTLAGLHAAHVTAGLVLVAWTMALAPRGRPHLARWVRRYAYFVAGAWLLVWPLFTWPRA